MKKIFISACFMGEKVRYDGGHQLLSHDSLFYKTVQKWKNENRLISGCPECLGGLPVPRAPAEMQQVSQKIITVNGDDVSESFHIGALKALDICLENNIKFALLKESSPSCGSNTIYNGEFSKTKIAGQGVTAQLLTQHKIKVFSENTIEQLIAYIDRKSSI